MRVQLILYFTIFLLSISSAYTQSPLFKAYGIEQGLLSNECHDIINDSKGFIWTATDAGISRFDGKQFKNYSLEDGLPENTVLKVYEDHRKRIWFITISSFIGYIENDQIINIPGIFKNEKSHDTDVNFAYSIYVDEGDTLWVGTIFSGILFKQAPPYTKPLKPIKKKADFYIEFNQKGDHIYGTYTHADMIKFKLIFPFELTFIYEQKWKNQIKITRIKDCMLSPRKHILKLRNNAFILGGKFDYSVLNKNKITFTHQGRFTFMTLDSHKNFLFGVQDEGLYQLDDPTDFKSRRRLSDQSYPTAWTQDQEGGNWLTSIYEGLQFIPSFNYYKIRSGKEYGSLQNWINDQILTHEKPGNMIILQNDKIIFNKPLNIYLLTAHPKFETCFYYSMDNSFEMKSNSSMVIHPNGKIKLSSISKLYENDKFRRNFKVKSGFKLDDEFYVGDNFGIYQVKDYEHVSKTYYGLDRLYEFVIDNQKQFWMATSSGLLHFNSKNNRVRNWSTEKPEINKRIDLIAIDKQQNLWLGTKGDGIIFLNPKNNTIERINKKTGLSSNIIRKLYIDHQNRLWIANNYGLSLIDLKNNHQPVNFNFLHSINIGTINDLLVVRDMIYVTSNKGLFSFNIKELIRDEKYNHLKLYFGTIQANIEQVKPGIKLKYSSNRIRFVFHAITYKHQDNLRYRYRIRNLNSEEWLYTQSNSVQFNNLPAGNYIFEVQAVNNSLHSDSIQFPFSIIPPIWQRVYFILGMVILGGGLLYLGIKYRIKKIRHRERTFASMRISMAELEAKALRTQMNPHFMFNSLNSIQSFILQKDSVRANYYLGKFSKLMRKILENSKQDRISVENEISLIEHYIELEKMRCNDSFSFNITHRTEPNYLNINIPVMLIQPFVENAIIHGLSGLKERHGILEITFWREENYLHCEIKDNGIGRKASEEINRKKMEYHRSVSSSLSVERLKLYNKLHESASKVQIDDQYDASGNPTGTIVLLTLPIML